MAQRPSASRIDPIVFYVSLVVVGHRPLGVLSRQYRHVTGPFLLRMTNFGGLHISTLSLPVFMSLVFPVPAASGCRDYEEPSSHRSWIAMMFSAGMGIGEFFGVLRAHTLPRRASARPGVG